MYQNVGKVTDKGGNNEMLVSVGESISEKEHVDVNVAVVNKGSSDLRLALAIVCTVW